MRLKSIGLTNFRCFKEADFEFADSFNLIIGNNGKGKTTLLEAVSVAVSGFLLGSQDVKSRDIDKNDIRLESHSFSGGVTFEPQYPAIVSCWGIIENDIQPIHWERYKTSKTGQTYREGAQNIILQAKGIFEEVMRGEKTPLPVIVYYHTGRLWGKAKNPDPEKPGSRLTGYKYSLTDRSSDEMGLIAWLKKKELARKNYPENGTILDKVYNSVVSCVEGANGAFYDFERGDLAIEFAGKTVPFNLLSHGQRNITGMVADIARRAATLNPQYGDDFLYKTKGIVLIDEIDLHLHPEWQQDIVNKLIDVFPHIQFVATTHSPFIIQSLPRRSDAKIINLDDYDEVLDGEMSVEDIAEEIQGVKIPQRSKRYREMLKVAEDYYRLLDKSDTDRKSIDEKKKELDELMMPFSDDPAYQAYLKYQRESSVASKKDKDATG